MLLSIIITLLTIVLLILAIIFKPTIVIKGHKIDTFVIVALIGALVVLLFNLVPLEILKDNIFNNSPMNPVKILIILLSMALLSISLDEIGFFNFIAHKAVKLVKSSQLKLFLLLFIIIAILTVFTSNDIVILTFTLFICYFAKETKIDPIPYLVMEFITANTFSMLFIIGNPTNIYLASSNNITFLEYFKIMCLPTILGGLTSIIILLLLFHKKLSIPFQNQNSDECQIENKPLMIISLIHLCISTILLAISNYIGLDMWIISLCTALSLTIIITIYSITNKKKTVINIYQRLPYSLAIFVLAMYTLVLALSYNGVFYNISKHLNTYTNTQFSVIFIYGITSSLIDNVINNIPMSLAFKGLLDLTTAYKPEAIYATIIGSNIGAFLTPIGALAGVMWMSILREQKINFSFKDFSKYGLILTPIILLFSLIGLFIIL